MTAPAHPDQLQSIEALVAARRDGLPRDARDDLNDGLWGLALSGGGIRSATFCFGLLKALGQNKAFHRFDILSTVSGGGYIGATVGKLFQNARANGQGAMEVEKALGSPDQRWFAFWLRANGRYLIPGGGQDLLFAGANFGRNLLGLNIELALLGLLLGGCLVGFDLALWSWADCVFHAACPAPGASLQVLAVLSAWPTLWAALPPVVWWGVVLATAYWALPARAGAGMSTQRWLLAAMSLAGAVWLALNLADRTGSAPPGTIARGLSLPLPLMAGACGVLLAWVAGTLMAWSMSLKRGSQPDLSRNQLTGKLAQTLKIGLALAALGMIDRLAWVFAEDQDVHLGAAASVIALAVVVLRAVLPRIASVPRSLSPLPRKTLTELMHLAGLALVTLLLVFWTSLLHRFATLALFPELSGSPLQYSLSGAWLALLVVPPLLMVVVSVGNRDFLNRSSLFAFYRARLVRSYLGAANGKRFKPAGTDPTETYQHRMAANGPQVSVQDVHDEDDVAMHDYQPHLAGGPVHLINVCVNQTHDIRGGLFNRDRKGLLMTVGPKGRVRVGQGDWHSVGAAGSLTLGAWTAISGAAVSPGLGGSTRTGIAALMTLAGIRLGYWWDSTALQRPKGEALPGIVGKYGQLLSELRGNFAGNQRRDWYLSDGGHFENTAAYALLREECSVIVVADCGADPRYAFADLENLVRKARVDLQADITFLKPKLRPSPGPTAPKDALPDHAPYAFGSLNDLASSESHACLALARVCYRRSGRIGHLIIVKPNMRLDLPVDLVNFKADNPLFPQEPTTDQFFSEAQWESYFQLGHTLGQQLDVHFMRNVHRYAHQLFEEDDGSVMAPDTPAGQAGPASVPAPKRLPSRIAATGAVTASLSLGAFATVGVTIWQAVDSHLQTLRKSETIAPDAMKELSDLYARLGPGGPASDADAGTGAAAAGAAARDAPATAADTRLGEMASALLRISDAGCTPASSRGFRDSPLMQMMLDDTKKSCAAAVRKSPACQHLLDDDSLTSCIQRNARTSCQPQYWVRDYGAEAGKTPNCPGSGTLDVAAGPPVPDASLAGRPPPQTSGPVSAWPTAPSTPPASSAPGRPGTPGTPQTSPLPPPVASPSAGTAVPPVCAGKTVYLQIFGPEMRDRVRLLREPWRSLGANVPPVEDVWDTARRAGRKPPQAPAQPSVIFHDAASEACAQQLKPSDAGVAWSVTPLPKTLNGTPGVIEVWIPPARATDTTRDRVATSLPATGWCYQEDSGGTGPQRYGVHCHAGQAACDSARGPNPKRIQTACEAVDLSGAVQQLKLRGWGGSWYALQPTPFGRPYPQFGIIG